MAAITESSGDGSYSSSVLERLKAMDLIDQLEIADGLKQLLSSKDFTLKSMLNASASDLAKILGIDEYVAKIVSSAIKEAMATKDTAKI
jgi:DNA integrity scanning protein DisA with diadenylate cyclase activity